MKIVVYNHTDQYALSRRQVEIVRALLPDALWSKISEFHLCQDHRCKEMFEYSEETRIVFFSCPVKQKTVEIVESAVRELLVGLARLRSGSAFFLPLKTRERESYSEFVEEWLPKCIAALHLK